MLSEIETKRRRRNRSRGDKKTLGKHLKPFRFVDLKTFAKNKSLSLKALVRYRRCGKLICFFFRKKKQQNTGINLFALFFLVYVIRWAADINSIS